MSDFLDRISSLSPKRLALLALEQHEQLEASRSPIAVVGIGCRFPGGAINPAAYWELLRDGRDAIREVPRDRWDIDAYYDPDPDEPGTIATRSGGFLDRVDGFDPEFFGISPREARTMDPQQRLVLEVAWEALEHAGIAPESLAGSSTGVWMGVCNSDHFLRVIEHGGEAVDMYLASGNAPSVVAGRISYILGLRGPAISLDTACSSSLIALHSAVRALRGGEINLAIAGGVNVMCAPETMIALSRAHMLAPDGRCKTFDAAADGFARGEGCGIIVLKRLADAEADGDRILGIVRGVAANQDGRSGGLTVPNGPAQESVIRAALADAGLAPADVDYVEAHGTGTSLGDPIEVRALAAAYGAGRAADAPLVVGSVKTNFGHLESAAGIAGTIKAILSLQHEWIPRHLHFRNPSPHIPWSDLPVRIPVDGRDWRRGARVRRAGVSSFGFSGTNAHVIVEEAPDASARDVAEHSAQTSARDVYCLPLSARTPGALGTLAGAWANALRASDAPSLADAAYIAGVGRSHLVERCAVVATNAGEAAAALSALATGVEHSLVKRGRANAGVATDVVFLFTGQGAQYPGLGASLYDASPVVRDVLDRCDAQLGPDAAGRTLLEVLRDASESSPIHETRWTQPATFAVQMALVALWRSWGVRPAAVLGHSAGEYAAACAAGVFSLEQGLTLIAERGRLMHALGPGGAMAAVNAPVALVRDAIAQFDGGISIAAYNGDDAVVISGKTAMIDAACEWLVARGVEARKLWVPLASHSALMDGGLDAMEAAARRTTMHAPEVPVAWNLTGGAPLPDGAPDATYWRRHLREPVRFADGIRSLWADGFRNFLEIGPHPVLVALAARALGEPAEFAGVPSLRRGKNEWRELTAAVADLYVRGASIDWKEFAPSRGAPGGDLPTYPFERRRFWIDANGGRQATRPAMRREPTGFTVRRDANIFALHALPVAIPLFETSLDPNAPAWLGEHRVHGAALAAGPVLLELAQSAARLAGRATTGAVEEFAIHAPLVIRDAGTKVQLEISNAVSPEASSTFRIYAERANDSDAGAPPWQLCASGRLTRASANHHSAGQHAESIAELRARLGPETTADGFFARLASLGIELGASFRGIRGVYRANGETLARIELPAALANDAVAWVHPALLDAALQSLGLTVPSPSDVDDTYLLSAIERIDLPTPLPSSLWCHARLEPATGARPAAWRGDITLLADDGTVLGTLSGVTMHRSNRDALTRAAGVDTGSQLHYAVEWQRVPGVTAPASETFPSLDHLREIAGVRYAAVAREHDLASYDTLMPSLDAQVVDYVVAALRELGFDDTIGRAFQSDDEAMALGVRARHRRLFARLLGMLVASGALHRQHDTFVVARHLDELVAHANAPTITVASAERDLLSRCGPVLAHVLRGMQDPLELLFPDGELTEARRLYEESPSARATNATVAAIVRAAAESTHASQMLRVLEIGGGTGGTTSSALAAMPNGRAAYTFTDVSPLFLERAAERFREYSFVRYAAFDIEREPGSQNVSVGAYDIVIAANVLHAAGDLPAAVCHARSLLAPGGLLVLVEGVLPEPWVDLTFGLTDGWWKFNDGVRRDYPLLSPNAWESLLGECGFATTVVVPEGSAIGRAGQQRVIVARTPRSEAAARVPRSFTIVADRQGIADALAQRLTARGDVVRIRSSADAPDAPDAPDALGNDDLVYLAALDAIDVASAESEACARPLAWLAAHARGASARAWIVTRGAQNAGDEESLIARWQAPAWGVGRVFSLEQPSRWGGLVDLDPNADANAAANALLASLDATDGEDQTAWRNGTRLVARLVDAPEPRSDEMRIREDAAYLITGGFGGLGLVVAQWLAERGARTIVLLGRRPNMDVQGVRAIESTGARVISFEGDVADDRTMLTHFARFGTELPPLAGVIHAAASFSTGAIGSLADADVAAMLRPKIAGTVLLERLTRDLSVDWIVLFSSTTALLGAAGFAHYAAANAFLDATAHAARRAGRPITSINWGTWEVMRLVSTTEQQSYREAGLEPLGAAEACEAMSRTVASGLAESVVARVDWSTLKPLHEARRPRPFLADVGRTTPARVAPQSPRDAATTPLAHRLASAPQDAQRETLVDFVSHEVAAVLGADAGVAPAVDVGLFEMGMDSLMSVELRKRLERGSGLALPSTLTFNYPNIEALAGFLMTQLGAATAPGQRASAPSLVSTTDSPPALDDTADMADLTDDELEARLLARLESLR